MGGSDRRPVCPFWRAQKKCDDKENCEFSYDHGEDVKGKWNGTAAKNAVKYFRTCLRDGSRILPKDLEAKRAKKKKKASNKKLLNNPTGRSSQDRRPRGAPHTSLDRTSVAASSGGTSSNWSRSISSSGVVQAISAGPVNRGASTESLPSVEDTKTCAVGDCENTVAGKFLCSTHQDEDQSSGASETTNSNRVGTQQSYRQEYSRGGSSGGGQANQQGHSSGGGGYQRGHGFQGRYNQGRDNNRRDGNLRRDDSNRRGNDNTGGNRYFNQYRRPPPRQDNSASKRRRNN